MDKTRFNKAKYDNEYIKSHYWRMGINLPKEYKKVLENHVEIMGEASLASFIKRAIKETIERDLSSIDE